MQADAPLSPADAIAQAHADLSRLPVEARYDVRYLSLYAVPKAEREKAVRILNGHVNSLSREPDLTPLYVVPGSQGSLCRLYLRDYRWDTKVWEKLVDPYFTQAIEVERLEWWPGGNYDGQHYPAKAFQVRYKDKQLVLAPWLTETVQAKKHLEEVVGWTGSKIPVVRAEWFFNQTAAAVDRTPNYYDFLGVKDEKTFQDAIGADVKKAADLGNEIREAVAISGVTLQPRAIVRHGTINGSYWRTFDFKIAKAETNPLAVLGKDIEKKYDASEQYGMLANGMWAFGLFDRQGKIQATAPDFIASDGVSRSTDKRVHNGASCIRCHTNGGLQDIDGWIRNLMTPPLNVLTPDYEKARELKRLYLRKMEPFIEKDRRVYEDAIKEATGLGSKEYSASFARMWEDYEDAKVDLGMAAASLGCTPERLKLAIGGRIRAGRGDTVMSVLVLPAGRPNRIPIRQWEEIVPDAHATIRGYEK